MAHRAEPLKHLRGVVTQGGADAFAQASVTTGLSGETRKAYRVIEITVEWTGVPDANNDVIECQMTRKSFAAMTNVADKALIFKRREILLLTTSGAVITSYVRNYQFDHDAGDRFLIVEDPLYIAIDSTAVGTLSMYYDIAYEEVTISEQARLELLVASLS